MSPRDYIGVPDWRSALLALLFTLPWLYLFARGRLRRGWLWAAFAGAAVLFPFAIAWVQVPLQQGLSLLWLWLIGEESIRQFLPLVALPSLLVASLVQEGLKLGVAAAALRFLHGERTPRNGVAAGAGAGAGLGGIEAFWIFNVIFASGWTWGTVQLAGPAALLGFIERFLTVPFHIGTGAILGYGYGTGRTGRYFVLAVALHTLANLGVVLAQMGAIGPVAVEAWVAVWSAVTVGVALVLWRRAARNA